MSFNIASSYQVIAAIEAPGAINKILHHLGLIPLQPPKLPARYGVYARVGFRLWHPMLLYLAHANHSLAVVAQVAAHIKGNWIKTTRGFKGWG